MAENLPGRLARIVPRLLDDYPSRAASDADRRVATFQVGGKFHTSEFIHHLDSRRAKDNRHENGQEEDDHRYGQFRR